MGYFKEIEGEAAILVGAKGAYRQVPLCERDSVVYAKVGSVYYKLMADGSCSGPFRVDFVSMEHGKDALGRMTIPLRKTKKAA